MLAATAVFAVLPAAGPAAASPAGTWGPEQVPYDNGVVCHGDTSDTALVSWYGTHAPSFAAGPVSGSSTGVTAQPAVSGADAPVTPASSGLDADTIGRIAYLIDRHGSDSASGVVADVAADVLQQYGTSTSAVDDCLAQGSGGASQQQATTLSDEASRLAGPYTVTLAAPTTQAPGAGLTLTATVVSALGYPVPNLAVTFTPSGGGVAVASPAATTDSAGHASVDVTTSSNSQPGSPAVTATVSAVTGLVETTAPSQVSLVGAAAPTAYRDRLDLSQLLTPHPVLSLSTPSLALAGASPHPTLTVTGMNGHTGTAAVTVYGPLSISGDGCAFHTDADWTAAQAAHRTVSDTEVLVHGDGTYRVTTGASLAAGCYRPVARLTTTDASPNVRASTTGDTTAVAAVTVGATPAHGGVAPVGALGTALTATSSYDASWTDISGDVLGPRPATSGVCPTIGWTRTPVATSAEADTDPDVDPDGSSGTSASSGAPSATSSGSPSATSSGAPSATSSGAPSATATSELSSGAVQSTGCYGFRITATLVLPGLGNTTVTLEPGTGDAPVHVIAPQVSVVGLSSTGVTSGSRLAATVDVSATEGQAGQLQLQLLRMPYTWRGCFEADWSHAPVVTTAAAPVLTTNGDKTYRLRTAAVPGRACWTVIPLFTADANPAVRATAAAGVDPLLAFTSVARETSRQVPDTAAAASTPMLSTFDAALTMLALLAVTLLSTAVAARRSRRRQPIAAEDQLLSG